MQVVTYNINLTIPITRKKIIDENIDKPKDFYAEVCQDAVEDALSKFNINFCSAEVEYYEIEKL